MLYKISFQLGYEWTMFRYYNASPNYGECHSLGCNAAYVHKMSTFSSESFGQKYDAYECQSLRNYCVNYPWKIHQISMWCVIPTNNTLRTACPGCQLSHISLPLELFKSSVSSKVSVRVEEPWLIVDLWHLRGILCLSLLVHCFRLPLSGFLRFY